MSTATQLTHLRNSDQQAADGSNQVAKRTGKLIDGFQCARLNAVADEMLRAIECKISGKSPSEPDRFTNFLQRWSYDDEQLHAARHALAAHVTELT
jgi:X-X-X-Leu-X-X-Gly heptad repeat protein